MRAVLAVIAGATAMASTASQAEDRRIAMAGTAYAPATVDAEVGDRLVFVNDDAVAHAVFVPTVGFATDLGSQDPGSETTLTLGKTGVFDVECVFHDTMHARIVVRP